jgi:hypothetical protein
MTDKKGKCRFCGTEAYETKEEATRKLIQVYRNLDRQREAWAIDVIKAAVHAIEDVVAGDYGKYTDGDDCSHGKLEAEVCQHCIREHLIPHLEALKGLIDV